MRHGIVVHKLASTLEEHLASEGLPKFPKYLEEWKNNNKFLINVSNNYNSSNGPSYFIVAFQNTLVIKNNIIGHYLMLLWGQLIKFTAG